MVSGSRSRRSTTDTVLGVVGVILAAASVAFPWHVYFFPEQYAPPKIAFSGNWNPGVAEERPPAILAVRRSRPVAVSELTVSDPVVTASTPPDPARFAPEVVPVEEQPFPNPAGDYGVIFVLNRSALMSDGNGVFFVEVGSQLPDGSTVTAVTETPGGGEVQTSYDRTYSPGN